MILNCLEFVCGGIGGGGGCTFKFSDQPHRSVFSLKAAPVRRKLNSSVFSACFSRRTFSRTPIRNVLHLQLIVKPIVSFSHIYIASTIVYYLLISFIRCSISSSERGNGLDSFLRQAHQTTSRVERRLRSTIFDKEPFRGSAVAFPRQWTTIWRRRSITMSLSHRQRHIVALFARKTTTWPRGDVARLISKTHMFGRYQKHVLGILILRARAIVHLYARSSINQLLVDFGVTFCWSSRIWEYLLENMKHLRWISRNIY